MNKEIQPKSHTVTFRCASCGATYELLSTTKGDEVALDVCSNCHPLYRTGTTDQKAKGRAEKLANKFAAGAAFSAEKHDKKEVHKKANKSISKNLDDLEA
jgi:large subunit ribosomal protein L31